MKKTLILLLTFLPLILFGQNLKCCETKKEVESYLSGKWKEKNTESNTVYEYWFEDEKGHLTLIEIAQNGDELIELEVQPFVEIHKSAKGFELEIIYLYGSVAYEIKHLDSDKMIILTEEGETEYHKIE
ncbi:hypothetical protein BFR04_08255 [Gaetbulibacter sp. 4G1]|nr:hypothetical protein [Gaetbulibacter sp. 4G1]PIA77430.1 hypothetical protein BFR04_08255 [Gaetbulibacter sp. 4G1]